MKSPSVLDVAAYIIHKTGPISAMKLQKLVYYCQAWSLVWDEKPLFPEQIEAWASGPVVPKLFKAHRRQFIVSKIEGGNPDILNQQQKDTINAVLKTYSLKPAQWLVELTHSEEPWKQAREGLNPTERGAREIPLTAMAEYYSSIPKKS